MSKKTIDYEEQINNEPQTENTELEGGGSAVTSDALNELLKEGSTTLMAESRESIYSKSEEFVKAIPAEILWTRDAVISAAGIFYQTYRTLKI